MKDALDLGKAAEHLVCADLLLRGYSALLSGQGAPYDVLVDVGGRFVRVQVKSTLKPRNMNSQGKVPNHIYAFNPKRRGKRGAGVRLGTAHCDVVAFVALDTRHIAYLPVGDVSMTVGFLPAGYDFPGKQKGSSYRKIDSFPFERIIL